MEVCCELCVSTLYLCLLCYNLNCGEAWLEAVSLYIMFVSCVDDVRVSSISLSIVMALLS